MAGKKEYKNEDIVVSWDASICIHAAKCVKHAGKVFKPKDRPWIQMENDTSEVITKAIDACPSGALKYRKISDSADENDSAMASAKAQIIPNGPLMVEGDIEVVSGDKIEKKSKAFFCRCGDSANKPYCDGAHKSNGFVG